MKSIEEFANDPRSCERNLCNCVRSLKEKLGLQRDLNPRPRDPVRYSIQLRACLHGGGGPQVGEVTCLGEVKK